MQQLIIIGNVGKQAEVRQAPNGQAIGFSVAVNETYKDKQGQKQEKTTWFDVTVWKKLGESTKLAEYLKPGQAVSIIGRPTADAYINKDQKAVASLGVRVDRLELIGSPKGQAANTAAPDDEDTIHLRQQDDDNDLPF